MKGIRERVDYIVKHSYFAYQIFNTVLSTGMKIWGLFVSTDKKMVLFSAHTRKYNDSPKVLYEYMISHEKYSKYRFVWALDDITTKLPGNPEIVKTDTFKYFYYTLKAKYWITCVNIERGLHYKKKSCRFLNTWHGAPVKRGGNDCGGRKDFDFRAVDFFCYASDFEKGTEQRSFRVREEAQIPTGLPRNDELYRVTPEEIISIKNKLNLPLDKKVILYAPTWRDSTDGGVSYEIKPPIDIKKWETSLGDEYVLAMRTHQYTNKLLGIEFNDFCRDFCIYQNVNDLLKVADLMISDYSAIMADYSILERPILCFAYDYEWFRDTRGLYLDYTKEMPSGILRSEDEVLAYIKSMDFDKESIKTKQLLKNKLAQYGGHATEMCLEKLFEK